MAEERTDGMAAMTARELDARIGARTRLARGLARLTADALARELNWPPCRVSAWENGLERVSAADLQAVADVLRLPVTWFYRLSGIVVPEAEQRAQARHAAALDRLDSAMGDRPEAERAALVARSVNLADELDRARAVLASSLANDTAGRSTPSARMPGSQAQHLGAQPMQRQSTPAPQPGVQRSADPAAPRRRRILVVDDAPDVLVTTGAFVEAAGHEAVRARDADVALALLASGGQVDAIVTDYAMPTLSGVDLLLQAAQVRPGVPALIITGFADVSGLAELPPGIEVLHKPFRRAQFTAMLNAMLDGPAAQPAVGMHGPAAVIPG